MKKKIALLAGDGIGPEVTNEAVKVLEAVGKHYGHTFTFESADIGACAIEKHGTPLPSSTLDVCNRTDAILFGAIGDPRYDNDPGAKIRPEQGLLELRKTLGLYANIRPIFIFPSLRKWSPLKSEYLENVDFTIVRELTGGIYFGQPRTLAEDSALDSCTYTTAEVQRIAVKAFELAGARRKKLTLVDKANVLATSRLWRREIMKMSPRYGDIAVDYLYVDNAAMQIIRTPAQFDVILTENMFGDILSDEASMLSGSLGLMPSVSLGDKVALFEPIHGSYPQAAGKNIANPIGAILSAALLLEYSFGLISESHAIFDAVKAALEAGAGTIDINPEAPLSTQQMGQAILKHL